MRGLLGFVLGVSVATAGYGWAECCRAFNVPFDTQLAIEEAQQEARPRDAFRVPESPLWGQGFDPCRR